MPSCDLPNEYSGNQHECHLKRGGHAERVPQDARSRTEVCEHEPGEIQKNARCELPNGELQRIVAKPDSHENQADDTSPAQHLPRQHIGGIAPYEQERKRSSAMAYKNERDRICYQQNSCEPERHHGEMLGLSGIVLPPEPCGSSSNYHDPNRWHNHLSLPLMPAPIDMVHVPYRGGAPARRWGSTPCSTPAGVIESLAASSSPYLAAGPGRGLSSHQPRGKTHEHRPSLVSLFI